MQSNTAITKEVVEKQVARRRERTSPLGFWATPSIEGDKIIIRIDYLAHKNSADNGKKPTPDTIERILSKQEIINLIPEEYCKNVFELIPYNGDLDRKRWRIMGDIHEMLIRDLDKDPKHKSTDLLVAFKTEPKYQNKIDELAEVEALLYLFKQPKGFHGGDIRKLM